MFDDMPSWLPSVVIGLIGGYMLGEWEGWWRKKKNKEDDNE